MKFSSYFLSFAIYSFIGWLHESVLCSLYHEKRLINRGFLLGPYCPIYGFGAVLCFIVLGNVQSPVLIFCAAAVICCTLEYITSYVMEKLFHARWWDYSHYPFQLNGRICLYGALLFGAGNVVICKWLEPFILKLISLISPLALHTVSSVLFALMITDVIHTVLKWNKLRQHLKELHTALDSLREEMESHSLEEVLNEISDKWKLEIEEKKKNLHITIEDLHIRIKKDELRFFNAFPRLRIIPYEHVLLKMKFKENIHKLYHKKA